MKSQFFVLAAAISQLAGFAAAVCPTNGNNCARAITGTAGGPSQLASRRSDCAAYQLCTVTPTTSTIRTTTTVTPSAVTTTVSDGTPTSTVTVFTSPTPPPAGKRAVAQDHAGDAAAARGVQRLRRRNGDAYGFKAPEARHQAERRQGNPMTPITNCPSQAPVYATACPNYSAYTSACSCAGVMRSFTTLNPAVTTSTETSTAAAPTSTVHLPAPNPTTTAPARFVVRVGDATSTNYLAIVPNGGNAVGVLGFQMGTLATAQRFYIDTGSLFRTDVYYVEYFYDSSNGYLPIEATVSLPQYEARVTASLAQFDALNGGYPLLISTPNYPLLKYVSFATQGYSKVITTDDPNAYTTLPQLYAIFI